MAPNRKLSGRLHTQIRQEGLGTPPERVSAFAEQHFTIAQIAELWGVSKDTVRRLFAKEPGVLVFGCSENRAHKRRYTTLRIPESVVERVRRRCSLVS